MNILVVSSYELGHQSQAGAELISLLSRPENRVASLDMSLTDHIQRQLTMAISSLSGRSIEDTEGPWEIEDVFALADVIAFSVPMMTAASMTKQLIKRAKTASQGSKVSVFGLYASVLAKESDLEIDAYFAGEFHGPFVEWLESDAPLQDTECTTIEVTKNKEPLVPNRSAFLPPGYYPPIEVKGSSKTIGYTEATRGCRHSCLHCPVPAVYHGRIRVNQVADVLSDIANLVESGAQHITFGDPDFLNAPAHSRKVVDALHSQFGAGSDYEAATGSFVTFDATIKIEHILAHRGVIEEFAQKGCVMITSAVESLNDTVLAKLAKGHTKDEVIEATEFLHSLGITMHPSFLPFTPWTESRDLAEILDFCLEFGLQDVVEPVQFGIRLLVPPGSLLLEIEDPNVTLKAYDDGQMGYSWSHIDPTIDELAKLVAKSAELATMNKTPNVEALQEIRQIAYQFIGEEPPEIQFRPRLALQTRLTEPWFCCAEPRSDQLVTIRVPLRFEDQGAPSSIEPAADCPSC